MKEKLLHSYIEREYSNYKCGHEVKFFRKSIDFTFIDEINELHAIELKLKDWKSALNQIETNQLCANYCYLGIWYKNKESVPKEVLKRYGFGLIAIDKNKCDVLIPPEKSPILNENYCTLIKKQIMGE